MSREISNSTNQDWDLIISPRTTRSFFNLKELFAYKDLLFLFVKRDFISLYKQTILGPLWVIIQPVLTTITFYVVFTKIAQIGTTEIPPILFYMLGVTVWTFYADCVIKTSETFIANQGIFGKVYFPRLIMPFSIVITNFIKFIIQLALFALVYSYFILFEGYSANLSWPLVIAPFLILIMALLGLATGLIISALTTKYRDLRFLIQFGIQLAMYATPIVWPLKNIPEEHHWKIMINPMTSIIESIKVGMFGEGHGVFSWEGILYSLIFTLVLLLIGMGLFGRVEKSFMDTI